MIDTMYYIMEILPSKEIMSKNGLFNRISKIYICYNKNIFFTTVQEAKDYFWTQKALDLFRYCCKEEYCLTADKKGLHWTIAFGEPDNQTPGMIKWADRWRDGKQKLHDDDEWFNNNNFTRINHSAEHLF